MPPALSSATTIKRIHREVADIQKEDLGAITLEPTADNLFAWKGTIPGPEGSCYEGGVFDVDVALPSDYPFAAPKVTFKTRIYHMNISERGNICIDILKQNWSPALSLFKVMLSLSSLLTDPNPQDPLVPTIATEFVKNRVQHDQTARRWTELYAYPPHKKKSTEAGGDGAPNVASTSALPVSTVMALPSFPYLVGTLASSSSGRGRRRGRRKGPMTRASAAAAGANSDVASGSQPPSSSQERASQPQLSSEEAIVIQDSDEEGGQTTNRNLGTIVIEDSDDEGTGSGAGKRKRDMDANESGGGGNGKRRKAKEERPVAGPRDGEEVIVLDG